MKKLFTLAGLLVLASGGAALAQGGPGPVVVGAGTELFFSEYDEGAQPSVSSGVPTCPLAPNSAGSERAIEIYNPTTETVSLKPYSVRRYSNGSAQVEEEERLRRTSQSDRDVLLNVPNTLAPSSTYVFACGEATLAQILNVSDQLSALHSPATGPNVVVAGGAIYFNGNDAMALVRWSGDSAGVGTPMIVDIFGVIGNNPGTQWASNDLVTGVQTASANQSLSRKPEISGGGATLDQVVASGFNPTDFLISDEWVQYSTAFPGGMPDACSQSYVDLGQHTYTGPHGAYTPLSVMADFNNAISFYPNPAAGRVNVSLGTAKVGQLTIINAVGKSIAVRPAAGAQNLTVDVSTLTPGIYFVRCTSADGKITIYKELAVQ